MDKWLISTDWSGAIGYAFWMGVTLEDNYTIKTQYFENTGMVVSFQIFFPLIPD
jgi:hypothetical protein